MEGITNKTNTAQCINKPENPYLENTIASMEAAFQYGADIVELDIQPTKDGQFPVFHDWTLEFRTNRKGVGLMPSLDEVINHFPEKSLLIHIKSNNPNDGEMFARYVAKLPEKHIKNLSVYGGDKPIAVLKKAIPEIRVMSKATLKSSLLSYIAISWTGYIPSDCRNTQLHIPIKYAPFLWGWPNRFLNQMEEVNTRVIVVAGNGKLSEGFDTIDDIKQLSPKYTGGIWTNRIDKVAPLYNENSNK